MVEIPVALLVIALVLIGAVRTFRTAGSVQKDSHMSDQATAYGLSKLHELEFRPASGFTPGRDQVVTALGTVFDRSWTIARKATGNEVNVTLSWQSGKRQESLSMATILR